LISKLPSHPGAQTSPFAREISLEGILARPRAFFEEEVQPPEFCPNYHNPCSLEISLHLECPQVWRLFSCNEVISPSVVYGSERQVPRSSRWCAPLPFKVFEKEPPLTRLPLSFCKHRPESFFFPCPDLALVRGLHLDASMPTGFSPSLHLLPPFSSLQN